MFECGYTAADETISISLRPGVRTEGDLLKGVLRVTNRGSLAAHNVRANIIIHGKRIKTPVKTLLAAGGSHNFGFEKRLSTIVKGRYPLAITVKFSDSAQSQFSALSCTTFSFKEDPGPELECAAHALTLGDRGKLRVDIKNPGVDPMDIRATLLLPTELSSPRPVIRFRMAPEGAKGVVFEIVNVSAPCGATYPVFCFFEYDLKETHYTAVSETLIRITEKENRFWRMRWVLLAVGILFGATLTICRLKRKQ